MGHSFHPCIQGIWDMLGTVPGAEDTVVKNRTDRCVALRHLTI